LLALLANVQQTVNRLPESPDWDDTPSSARSRDYTGAANSDLNLAVSYPPIRQWLSGEIHVDLSLQLLQSGLPVYDANGQVTFGPGQDWDVYCLSLPSPKTGCTFTIGAWKNHLTVSNGALPVVLGTGNGKSLFVTTQQQVSDVLNQNVYGNSSNGITKLYAQLLAAQLDVGSGANGTAVASTISAANAFLDQYNWQDWSNLSKAQQQVVSWQTTLANHNLGTIGPGHCP